MTKKTNTKWKLQGKILLEDTKGANRSIKSKDRQYNDQKRTNNDLQTIIKN